MHTVRMPTLPGSVILGSCRPRQPACRPAFMAWSTPRRCARPEQVPPLAMELCVAIEDWGDLPLVSLPDLDGHDLSTASGATEAAAAARAGLDVPPGPVPHVVRLLESRGVLVLALPDRLVDRRVAAFSTSAPHARSCCCRR